jgi:hypothetical protein
MHHSFLGWSWSFALAAGLMVAGCSSDDSGTTPPAGTGGTAGSSGAAGNAAGSGGAAGSTAGSGGAAGSVADAAADSDQPSDAQPSETSAGLKVKVTYQGSSTEVDLNQGELYQNAGDATSILSSVILLALPSKTITTLQANFLAGDGYNPADKSSCASFVPVAGDNLKKGWISRATRDLSWDASLGFPGCVNVKDLAEILVEDKP